MPAPEAPEKRPQQDSPNNDDASETSVDHPAPLMWYAKVPQFVGAVTGCLSWNSRKPMVRGANVVTGVEESACYTFAHVRSAQTNQRVARPGSLALADLACAGLSCRRCRGSSLTRRALRLHRSPDPGGCPLRISSPCGPPLARRAVEGPAT